MRNTPAISISIESFRDVQRHYGISNKMLRRTIFALLVVICSSWNGFLGLITLGVLYYCDSTIETLRRKHRALRK